MVPLWRDYWLLAALLLIAALVYFLARRARPAKPPYQKRRSLLTAAEIRFYRVLQGAVVGDWPIFAMVRLADLIQVKAKTAGYQRWFNPIVAKHVDFVICDPETLEPRLAIELDDASHNSPKRIARDQLVNAALAAAGLPLLRVRAAKSYDAGDLRKQVTALL
jgi:very-short-patch-repair endonuclease